VTPAVCVRCGTSLAPGLLRCPSCRALVHADGLAKIAAEADRAAAESRLADATQHWHVALELLPPDAPQRAQIDAKLHALGERMERGEGGAAKPKGPSKGVWAGIAAAAIFLVTKGKLLLVALLNGGAILSMFAFLGIYWRAWGWVLALGMLVSIYLHELGHMFSLMFYRVPVSAPMFVPGFGAFVRHGVLPTPRIGARVALAGPAAGLGAALVAFGIGKLTGGAYWSAIAHFGALINLGNLIPVWQLDGRKVIAPWTIMERILFAAALVATAVVAWDRLTTVVVVAALVALAFHRTGGAGDRRGLVQAAAVTLGLGVVLALSA
jgi:Zn-dependent protease